VAKQWRGHEEALACYGVAICPEWCRGGHADTCELKIREALAQLGITTGRGQVELATAGALPPWLGDDGFHRSHRSSLLNKDPEWYGDVFTDVPPDLPSSPSQPEVARRGSCAAVRRRRERPPAYCARPQ
jgi:hypothetical protein